MIGDRCKPSNRATTSRGSVSEAKRARGQALKGIVVVLAVGLVVGLGFNTVNRAAWSPYHSTDFTVYLEAGKAVLDGTNIYEAHNVRGWYYLYPPIFAILMVPFALMNVFWASLLWYAISVLMLVQAVQVSVRLARGAFPTCRLENFWLCALTVLLVLWQLWSGITRGQTSVLVTFLVSIAVSLFVSKRQWLAGLCLAGSIVVKVAPALLVVYFLGKRRFGIVASTAAWLVLLTVIIPSGVYGVQRNQELLVHWMTKIARPANAPEQARDNVLYGQVLNPRLKRNQSVQAVMFRWLAGRTKATAVPEREPLARRTAMAVNAALLVVCAWACCQGNAGDDTRRTLLELCSVVPLILFLSPNSWSHSYILLTLPLAVGIAMAFSDASVDTRRALRVGLVTYALCALLAITVRPLHVLGALLWGTLALWAAFVFVLRRRGATWISSSDPSGSGSLGQV